MPRRHRGHPGETEPPENADHEGPAPADLLQMWITGRQPQTAATPETASGAGARRAATTPTTAATRWPTRTTWTDAVDLPWTETDDVTPVEDEPEEAPDEPEPVAEVARRARARRRGQLRSLTRRPTRRRPSRTPPS